MARVFKEHDQRRNELLDVAQALFVADGYDATPVSAILDKAGVAKGTFYHYFESKEELLDQLVQRMSRTVLAETERAIAAETGGPIAQLNTFFRVGARWKAENPDMMLMLLRALYSDQNILLRHKMTQGVIALCLPHMTRIIEAGYEQGVFDAPHPAETAELIMRMATAVRESMARFVLQAVQDPARWDQVLLKLDVFERGVERILGTAKGALALMDKTVLATFRRRLQSAAQNGAPAPGGES